jgi:hypothetical protein
MHQTIEQCEIEKEDYGIPCCRKAMLDNGQEADADDTACQNDDANEVLLTITTV